MIFILQKAGDSWEIICSTCFEFLFSDCQRMVLGIDGDEYSGQGLLQLLPLVNHRRVSLIYFCFTFLAASYQILFFHIFHNYNVRVIF